mmetsp:Transcript_81300/g.174018  ORF Transcript_81300/g.174018 Transcript_81300/m.174018 type:complete len:204 (+) Transcript_81300:2403-3014(+)
MPQPPFLLVQRQLQVGLQQCRQQDEPSSWPQPGPLFAQLQSQWFPQQWLQQAVPSFLPQPVPFFAHVQPHLVTTKGGALGISFRASWSSSWSSATVSVSILPGGPGGPEGPCGPGTPCRPCGPGGPGGPGGPRAIAWSSCSCCCCGSKAKDTKATLDSASVSLDCASTLKSRCPVANSSGAALARRPKRAAPQAPTSSLLRFI